MQHGPTRNAGENVAGRLHAQSVASRDRAGRKEAAVIPRSINLFSTQSPRVLRGPSRDGAVVPAKCGTVPAAGRLRFTGNSVSLPRPSGAVPREAATGNPAGRAARLFCWPMRIAMHLVAKTDLDRRIAERVAPAAQELGLELVRVRSHDSREPKIQIMAERLEGSIDLSDCARLSRAVQPILDALSPGRSFALEVSSPGIDRPLTRLEDFSAFAGSEARIEIGVPYSGRRRFRGKLLGTQRPERAEEGTSDSGPWVVIRDADAGEVRLPFAEIVAARLVAEHGGRQREQPTRRNRKH